MTRAPVPRAAVTGANAAGASVTLFGIVIWLPTATEAQCSLLECLATRFGLPTNADAMSRLLNAWRNSNAKGRIDIDCEAEFVSVHAGRTAIVQVAKLIHELTVPAARVPASDEEIASARSAIDAHRRPRKAAWSVGDVFAVALKDASYAFGQVLHADAFGPSCVLFEHRSRNADPNVEEVLTSRSLAIFNVPSLALDTGRWRVIASAPLAESPERRPRDTYWDGLDALANAWFGLEPWNGFYERDGSFTLYHRADYLDQMLLPGVRRPLPRA